MPRTGPERGAVADGLAADAEGVALLAGSPGPCALLDGDGTLRWANRAFERASGLAALELAGRPLQALVEPTSAPVVLGVLRRLAGCAEATAAVRLPARGRESLHVLLHLHELPARGTDRRILCHGTDVSRRVNAEERLRRALDENRALLESSSSLLVTLDARDVVTSWNPAAARTLGLTADQMLGQPLRQRPVRWDWESLLAALEEVRRTRRSLPLEALSFVRIDGSPGLLRLSVNPVRHGGRARGCLLLCGEDVTDTVRMRDRLVEARRLEALGQLASGIAHEINTPVQFVADNLDFLAEAFEDLVTLLDRTAEVVGAAGRGAGDGGLAEAVEALAGALERADADFLRKEVPAALDQARQGVERVAGIVCATKQFADPEAGGELRETDLNAALADTLEVCRHQWRQVARVETFLDPDLPRVACQPGVLNQAFLQLVVNAARAVAERNRQEGRTRGRIRLRSRAAPHEVVVEVEDDGPGVPAELRPRIFEPFFTTREVGSGSGQGLWIARSAVVDGHGGRLEVDDVPGGGARFRVVLPRGERGEPSPTRAAAPRLPGPRLRPDGRAAASRSPGRSGSRRRR